MCSFADLTEDFSESYFKITFSLLACIMTELTGDQFGFFRGKQCA